MNAAGNPSPTTLARWMKNEAAARAVLDETATDTQRSLLAGRAHLRGLDITAFARLIVVKAEQLDNLNRLAGEISDKAYSAIDAATADTVPLDEVGQHIDSLFAGLEIEVAEALKTSTPG